MATETLYADAVLASDLGIAVTDNALGAPDSAFTLEAGSWDMRLSMGSPSGGLSTTANAQQFTIHLRKDQLGEGDPTLTVELWDFGSSVRTLVSGATITDSTTTLVVSWTGSEVVSGSDVEIRLIATESGGSPSRRRSVEIDAVEWTADLAAAATPSGSTTGTLLLDGSATGATVRSGEVAGGLLLDGSASGSTPHSGSATGSLDLDGTATGDAPTVAGNSGSAAGTLLLDGSATGSAPHSGSATGSLDLDGSATGDAPTVGGASGSASGALLLDGSATGEAPTIDAASGSTTGSLDLDGSATGSARHSGAAVGDLVLDGSASGATSHSGSISGGLSLDGTATGDAPGLTERDLDIVSATEPVSGWSTTPPGTAPLTAAEPASTWQHGTPGSDWSDTEPEALSVYEPDEPTLPLSTEPPAEVWEFAAPAL